MLAILITALVALGPLSTDFYLPALPWVLGAVAVVAHGGTITVESTIGVGTTLIVTVPTKFVTLPRASAPRRSRTRRSAP